MPTKAKVLSALAVKNIKNDGRYAVGGIDGLHLRVVGASRAWVLRVVVQGRRRDIGLGSYPILSLAEARDKAMELHRQIREGIDPIKERAASRARAKIEVARETTFKDCATTYIARKREGWKNEKHAKQWENTLATYVFPLIGDLPVTSIDTGLVLKVLLQEIEIGDKPVPLWHCKTETASRLRGRIERVLGFAGSESLRSKENPARWKDHLDQQLAVPSKVKPVKHHAALPYSELGAFMVELRRRRGVSARALELAILTAARSNEIRGATWNEVDFRTHVWKIPVERMKADKEHRVPLSGDAVKLLKALPKLEGNSLIFPAPRGGKLSDMAMTSVLRRMGRADLTQHGFRSTFRDWAGETTAYPREVCEHALAHRLKDGVEAAYQRGDMLNKRARMMEDWARYCATARPEAQNVVSMRVGEA